MNVQLITKPQQNLISASFQLSALQELLVNDYYLFLDSELKIVNYSYNCIALSKSVLKCKIETKINILQLLNKIEEDLSELKLRDFLLNNIKHEIINFKFQIGGELLMMSVRKVSENDTFGYICLLESHAIKNDINEIFGNMHMMANLSWFTSHKLRGPLSTILSLIDQDPLPEIVNNEQLESLFSQMKTQAMNLDEALHTLNNLLSNKEKRSPITPKFSKQLNDILMLDDEIIVHKLSKKIISDINPALKLFSFTDGVEALEFLQAFPIDLILLDLNMQEINGWEFLQLMEEKGINTPTIIISSSIDTKDVNRSFEYPQVKGFINKPICKVDLKRILSNSTNIKQPIMNYDLFNPKDTTNDLKVT